MPFLPSLLEYTPQDLESRLRLIQSHISEFHSIQQAVDGKIHLHLDFVLPEFAAERDVQPGNSPAIVFGLIHQYFHDQKVVCNSHFMGSSKDTQEVLEFFQAYQWNPNWEYILYVGKEFVSDFFEKLSPLTSSRSGEVYEPKSTPSPAVPPLRTMRRMETLLCQSFKSGINQSKFQSSIKIGTWLDLDQYSKETKFEYVDNLLMTVLAGKSGQKLTSEVRANCLKIVESNPKVSFTIDGGWTVLDELSELNIKQKNKLNVVSYSSFWKELNYKIEQKK
jgi:hypothetical protein